MKNRPLTKDDKLAVIQRGMARLPAMGEEAKWAFGAPPEPGFAVPPPWVRRVVLMAFGIDPDTPATKGQTDPLKVSKMVGTLVGLAEGAAIVLRPAAGASTIAAEASDEEKLKRSVAAAASPYFSKVAEHSGAVRQEFAQKTAEQYAAFTAGQSDAAQEIAAEEKEPGSTSDLTHELLGFLWTFWPEIQLAGSVQRLHQWIRELGYIHCSEELLEKVCRKAQLRLSKRGRKPRIPTN